MIPIGTHLLDLDRGVVHTPHGPSLLSGKEHALLRLLVPRAGTAVPRDEVLRHLWPEGLAASSRAPDVLFSRLRARLEPPDAPGRFLKTIRGEGYLFVLPPPGESQTEAIEEATLIGRAPALDRAREWLERTRGRWLTWTGLGGVGKTCIARAFAAAAARDGHAVAWVDLAPHDDDDGPLLASAEALGLDVRDVQDLPSALRVGLGARRTLLFLDNLEHLPAASARLGTLLTSAPGVRVVATSRRTLGVTGEVVHRLSGLSEEEACGLFRAQAQRVVPAQAEDLEEALVRTVCASVDGLPLAIELAVATLRFAPPQHLLAALERHQHGLEGELLGRAPRQASLEATLAYSWALLDEAARRGLVALSYFAGVFRRDDVEASVGLSLRTLGDLVQQSLVAHAPGGGHRLHPVVRSFARSRRGAMDPDGTCERGHRLHFLGWARSRIDALRGDVDGDEDRRWRARLPDLSAAWRSALAAGDLDAARMGWPGLREWIELRNALPEARVWCGEGRAALAGVDDELHDDLMAIEVLVDPTARTGNAAALVAARDRAADPATRVRLGLAAGAAAAHAHEKDAALALLTEAAHAARDLGDADLEARAVRFGWVRHVAVARSGQGLETIQAAVEGFRSTGNAPMLRRALGELGASLSARDHLDDADAVLAEALHIATRAGDEAALYEAHNALAGLRRRQGRAEEALEYVTLAAEAARRRGAPVTLLAQLRTMGSIELDLGRFEAAERSSRAALDLARQYGGPARLASALAGLGHVQMASHRFDDAVETYFAMREVLEEHLPDEGYWDVVCSGNLACALRLAGRHDEARTASERALALVPGFSLQVQGQVRALHAAIRADAGETAGAAEDALESLRVLGQIAPWEAWRAVYEAASVLLSGGREGLVASVLPLLRAEPASPEKWMFLADLEASVGDAEPEPTPASKGEAMERIGAALEELARGPQRSM